MKKNAIFVIIILIFLSYVISIEEVTSNSGSSFYISNDGDDSNDGQSPETPWKTIEKVNIELKQGSINKGDDIFFNRGDSWDFPAALTLYKGGSNDNDMIIGAYGVGEKPRLTEQGHQAIYCNRGVGHITIQDLNLTDNDKRSIFFYKGCGAHNITLRNLEIINPSGSGGDVITFFNTKDVLIENCNLNMNSEFHHGISIQHYGFDNNQCGNFIIRNCTITNVKDGISIHYGDVYENYSLGNNFWIENCTISNTSEECIDVVGGYGCKNVFIQNCEMYNCHNLVVGHGQANVVIDNVYFHNLLGNGITLTRCYNVIIRNSIIYEWGINKNGISKNRNQFDPDETNNICIYNNHIISTGGPEHIQINNENIDGLIFKNNIFHSTANSSPGLFIKYISPATFGNTSSKFSYNMWWRGDGGNNDDTWWSDSEGSNNFAEWLARSEVSNDLIDDPEITNPEIGDFRLNISSPCIDAGDWLTYCRKSGNGIVIPVEEAGYFFPGISDIGVTGDNIFVGKETDLEIVAVNYNANKITVNRSIVWDKGDKVSFSSFNGTSPDIGAGEVDNIGLNYFSPKNNPEEFKNFLLYFLIISLVLIFTFAIITRKF
jgi:hypothetical protein